MLRILSLLAAADVNPLSPSPPPILEGGKETHNLFSSQMRDVLLICGAALAVALVLFLWAYMTRKDRQKATAVARGARILSRPERRSSGRDPEGHRRKVRIRKRRREHADNFGRNPTLAEAGGLPPLRPEEPEPPPETPPNAPPTQPQPQTPTR